MTHVDKLLLPWTNIHNTQMYCYRGNVSGAWKALAQVSMNYLLRDTWRATIYNLIYNQAFEVEVGTDFCSMESAMLACDEKLLSLGYEFVDERRAEKLRLLL